MEQNQTVHKSPEYLKSAVMYQLFLRPFTPEGTLNAAAKLLPHIASLGVDIVYLCPPFCHDEDEDREGWSPRQHKSGMENAKNPYRMSDYYNVDPEYGTNDDLKDFIAKAHDLNMRVILDLVYYHCGPNAVFLADHPDFIHRNEDGTPKVGGWKFPELNYENPELCEYMWQNMELFVGEYDCDGYRCDVGDAVPLFFWEEGRRRIEAIKPDVIMLNEGTKQDYLVNAFDISYDFNFRKVLGDAIMNGNAAASVRAYREKFIAEHLLPTKPSILCYDNHDISNDSYDVRWETNPGYKACDLMLFTIFTMEGVPFLYNGNEVADANRHSIWASRSHGHNNTIDWQNALTEEGRERLEFVRRLTAMRHMEPALSDGDMKFVDATDDSVLAYTRTSAGQKLLIALNLSGHPVTTAIEVPVGEAAPIYGRGAAVTVTGQLKAALEPYGFVIAELL